MLLWAVILTGRAEAQASEQTVRRVLEQGVESPPTARQLNELGAGVERALIAVWRDETAPQYVRMRALSALRHYRSAETRRFLRALIRAPRQRPLVVRRALQSLAMAQGSGARTDLIDALRHPAAMVRRVAVHHLARLPGPKARAALKLHLKREPSAAVRRAAVIRRGGAATGRLVRPTGRPPAGRESAPRPR